MIGAELANVAMKEIMSGQTFDTSSLPKTDEARAFWDELADEIATLTKKGFEITPAEEPTPDTDRRTLSYREKVNLLLKDAYRPDADVSEVADTDIINLPFGEYDNFADCVAKNQDKDNPDAYCGWIKHRIEGGTDTADAVNLPDISDVSFPTMIGAIPSKPPQKKRKKKGPVNYHGVRLSRWPMKFEAQILSLTEIPVRLDMAVTTLRERPSDDQMLLAVMQEMADYGATEVLHELVRQGAPTYILERPPVPDVTDCAQALLRDRSADLSRAEAEVEHRVSRRHLRADRHKAIVLHLFDLRARGIMRRYTNRAVNESFLLGRSVTIAAARAQRGNVVSLAKHGYRDEEGKFTSIIDAVNAGEIAVDAVIQTAVMDTSTCDPCAEVDGEQMELGDARQQELHPPYVNCLGGDACRCVQIAMLENGMEINVDEIDEDAIP